MDIKLLADSSCNLQKLSGASFATTPLRIITEHKEYVDNADLNVQQMVTELEAYKGRSSTSCPNIENWLHAFGDAENALCVTITSALSGSYAAAEAARSSILEQFPQRNLYVLDSRSVGPEMQLHLEKAQELAKELSDFSRFCLEMEAYKEKTELLFILSSMKNLANNGRVSPVAAKMAGLLGIRAIGRASEQGTLQLLDKVRGEQKALLNAVSSMRKMGYAGGKVRIAHCFNEAGAENVKRLLQDAFGSISVEILPCTALCSFYSENGGLLIGYEKG